jgi:hypothetical protein
VLRCSLEIQAEYAKLDAKRLKLKSAYEIGNGGYELEKETNVVKTRERNILIKR